MNKQNFYYDLVKAICLPIWLSTLSLTLIYEDQSKTKGQTQYAIIINIKFPILMYTYVKFQKNLRLRAKLLNIYLWLQIFILILSVTNVLLIRNRRLLRKLTISPVSIISHFSWGWSFCILSSRIFLSPLVLMLILIKEHSCQ